MTHFAYLHGFASGPRSKKGVALAEAFRAEGHTFDLLDLNRPSFSKLTLTAQLQELERWAADKERVALIGSSMGAWVASAFAAREAARTKPGEAGPTNDGNISKIEKLVLLAPGFDMVSRWPKLVGPDGMAAWRAHGALPFPDADKTPTPVHWAFLEDALTHPATPSPPQPALVIHGTRDAIVPIETSRAWVARRDHTRLIEVDDDHELVSSLPLIVAESLAFLTTPR